MLIFLASPVFPAYAGMFRRLEKEFMAHMGFPAYAGMFRFEGFPKIITVGFPRIRGDVPSSGLLSPSSRVFSPHTRGCFHVRTARIRTSGVFPAYAGMFLCSSPAKAPYYRFPRIRGDIPVNVPRQEQVAQFSPRARGCSSWPQPSPPFGSVFPACAGMFCQYGYSTCCSRCFPRVRGDVPVAVSPNAAF